MSDDPFAGILERSSVAQSLRDARASLARPSRPFTPASRSLFQQADDSASCSRPSSSYSLDQLKFVRDVFTPPGARDSMASTRSSLGSRGYGCQPIPELEEPELQLADVLELGQAGIVITEGYAGEALLAKPPRHARRKPPESEAAVMFGRFGTCPDEEYDNCAADDLALCMDLTDAGSDSEDEARRPTAAPEKLKEVASEKGFSSSDVASALPSVAVWDATLDEVLSALGLVSVKGSEAGSNIQLPEASLPDLADKIDALTVDLVEAGPGLVPSSNSPALFKAALTLLEQRLEPACLVRLARGALQLLKLESVLEDVGSRGAAATYLNVARAMFKLSKDAALDSRFRGEGLVQLLLDLLSFEHSSESWNSIDLQVFLVGTLKNISNNDDNQKFLVKKGALRVLARLMKSAETGTREKLLIQVTALLRNLVASSKRHKEFLSLGLLDSLVCIMSSYMHCEELQVNVARILGKLTAFDVTCEALAEELAGDKEGLLRQIMRCLAGHSGNASLVNRHAFVLGNLTSKADTLREVLVFDLDGQAVLPSLLDHCWQQDQKLAQIESGRSQESEATLVKLVRLVANVTISPSVGACLAGEAAVVDVLLAILSSRRMPDSEELVLCATAAVTNLLFYDTPENLLLAADNKQLLCRLLRPMLLESYNVEALVETARALGNLSRHQDARQCIAELRIDEVLSILLAHSERELVFYACGALVNLAADPGSALRLCRARGLRSKLAALLRDVPAGDEELLLVAAKVLSNLHLDCDSEEAWPAEELASLRLGLDRVLGLCRDEASDFGMESRELLQDLAGRLLESLPSSSSEGKL